MDKRRKEDDRVQKIIKKIRLLTPLELGQSFFNNILRFGTCDKK